MTGMPLMADHSEGRSPILLGMQLVPTIGTTHGIGTHAATTDATSRTVPEMGS